MINGSCLSRFSNCPIVDNLKRALASEYYAYHMYRSAYYMVKGLRRSIIIDELKDHAKEELEHANMLEERIAILGGSTFCSPNDWAVWDDYNDSVICSSNEDDIINVIKRSEEKAVELYKKLYNDVQDDPVTQDIILRILSKEQEHLYDVIYNIQGTS